MAAISTNGRKTAVFIDMTPMVDLAFLLLTFFVLTSNLVKPWTIEIDMPSKVKDPIDRPLLDAKRAMSIVLGDQNKVYWYMGVPTGHAEVTDFSVNGLRKILTEKKESVENLYVLIKPSDHSHYKNVIDALDEMIITEITRYSIVEPESEDKKLFISN